MSITRHPNHLKFNDNVRLYLGTGPGQGDAGDTYLYFDGTSLRINTGTAALQFDGELRYTEGPDLSYQRVIVEDFEGQPSATLPPHLSRDLHASGTGDYATGGEGHFALGLTATDAAEAAQILGHEVDITKNPKLTVRFRIDGLGLDATGQEQAVIGFGSTHATAEAALDDVAVNAWFLISSADNSILYESDDGTTDDDDNDSGVDLTDDTYVEVEIDAADLTAVAFSVNGTAVGTTDMTDATGIVRFIACIQRNSDTGTEAARSLEVDYYRIIVDR